jgi:hypothetical protein
MTDLDGRTMATCLRCGREAPADPERTLYCNCRSRRAGSAERGAPPVRPGRAV